MSLKTKGNDHGLANHEIVTLAVYLLGGSTHAVDTEDAAMKANEIAPGRFTWHKYKEQISLDAVRKRLWDAQSEEKEYRFLSGSERDGWMLTKAGVIFSEENIRRIHSEDLSRNRPSEADKRWLSRERMRLLSSEAYAKFRDGHADKITLNEIATFFRVDEYITGNSRDRKVARIVNAFFGDPVLGPAVDAIAEMARGSATE